MGRCWMLLEGNKTRPAETFCSTSPESFWQPAAFCLHRTQRRGQKTTWGLTLSSPRCTLWKGRTHWLTDCPLCISKCFHLFVPWSVWEKKTLLFCAGPFYEHLPMISVITEQTENSIRILFLQTFYFPFIFYQYESHRHQVVCSVERDVLILS